MIIFIISIAVIIFAVLLYKGLGFIEHVVDDYSKKEDFENSQINNSQINNSQSQCNDLENLHDIYLTTPCAVNIPIPEFDNTFFIGINDTKKKDNFKITGKYCFPKEKLLYDGIWDSNKVSVDEFESVLWTIPETKPVSGVYCGDKFLDLPEKPLAPNDIIFEPDACEKYFPAATNTRFLCEQLSEGDVCSSNPNDSMDSRSHAFEI